MIATLPMVGPAWSLGIAALLLWIYYRRFRRGFGRQPVRPARLAIRVTLFGALLALALLLPAPLWLTRVGAAGAGFVLALVSIRLTKFGHDEKGPHYVPNTWIGLALAGLLLARLIFRFAGFSTLAGGPSFDAGSRPTGVTLALLALLVAYYVTYDIVVLFRSRARPPAGAR